MKNNLYISIRSLSELIKEINLMELPKYNKERIIETIKLEINHIKYDLIRSLGEASYEALEKEENK